MTSQDPVTSAVWYVKSQGAIRGPFSESVLLSFKDAGRLRSDTLISADRQDWKPISILGSAFAQLELTLTDNQLPIPQSNGHGAQFYIHLDGQTIGPFGSQALQERILAGALGPTDPVWMQGNQNWLPAARMPGLAFPVKHVPIPLWLKRNAIVIAAVAFAVLILIVAPSWYVLSLNANRESKLNLQNQILVTGVKSGETTATIRAPGKSAGRATYNYWLSICEAAKPIIEVLQKSNQNQSIQTSGQTAFIIEGLPTLNVDQDVVRMGLDWAGVLRNRADLQDYSNDLTQIGPDVLLGWLQGDLSGGLNGVAQDFKKSTAQLKQMQQKMAQMRAVLTARYGFEFPEL